MVFEAPVRIKSFKAVPVRIYRGEKMETNTKDTGISMISVKRNPYLEDYGKKRNASLDRAEYRRRGWELKRALTRRNGRKRVSWPDSQRGRAAKRRQRLQIQCAAVFLGLITLAVVGVNLLVKHNRASAAGGGQSFVKGSGENVGAGSGGNFNAAGIENAGAPQDADSYEVQGIPVEVFARHPEWKEDFLTPNEYSRPGDELKEVKNIFVHYTANPGTSAAQNRSYFERQKDEHLASVSSHFIIGYEGEIIQCVPLNEIAYAVQTRNFDSVSIECCYKAKDGSFTQETYDSLISLLAWLTDVYDLDTEDILRHYDCGGKKCPLYYTDHKDKWEQLKEDVKEMKL